MGILTGRFERPDWSPARGQLTATLTARVVADDGVEKVIVVEGPVTASLGGVGDFSVELRPTDDPGYLNVEGVLAYDVRESVNGRSERAYSIVLPSPWPWDLADVAYFDAPPGVVVVPTPGPPGPAGATDHGLLTGLSDPDHPITAVQGLQVALDGKAGAVHPHPEYLPVAGGTVTGALVVEGGSMFAGADMGGLAVTGVANPVDGADAANKSYVDANAGGGGGVSNTVEGGLTIKGGPLTAFDDTGSSTLRFHMHDGAGVYPAWPQFHVYLQANQVVAGWGTGTGAAAWQVTIPMNLAPGGVADLVLGFPILLQDRLTLQVGGTWEKNVLRATPTGITQNGEHLVAVDVAVPPQVGDAVVWDGSGWVAGAPAVAALGARVEALEARLGGGA